MYQKNPLITPQHALATESGQSVAKTTSRLANPCLCDLGLGTHIVVGNTGDHNRVLAFLTQHYQVPLTEDFQSRLDDPTYEPTDRMLLVRSGQLIGHLQLSRQSAWFERERIPTTAIHDCVILPEMQPVEFMAPLLATAESTALAEGAILAMARPTQPKFFTARGWSTCRAQGHTQANTRALLAHITAQLAARKHRHAHVEVRTWWHYELEAIQPVYEQVATAMWGTLHRSEDTWRWLVSRNAHDQILLAVRHKPENNAESAKLRVVGYAVVRDSCIVEMITLPGYAAVRLMLVARACRDAIDRDHHFVSLHTPATDPMHELLVTAGGSWHACAAQHGSPWMHKLLSPEKWVERLYPQLYHRAKEAGISRPLEISFAVDERCYRFLFTRRSARLEHALPAARADVTCDTLTFQELLTSNLAWTPARERGVLHVVDPAKAAILAALFPPRLFWQSPFELLRL